MNGRSSSPSNLQKSLLILSATNKSTNNERNYLPSRYAIQRNKNKNEAHNILTTIETNLKQQLLATNNNSKIIPKRLIEQPKQLKEFRTKPMKRAQSDMLNFKEIFIEPKTEILTKMHDKQQKKQQIEFEQILQYVQEHISIVKKLTKPTINTDGFYEQMIKIENNENTVCISLPIITKQHTNLKELLMRCGMNAQDIQKQSHLCYYLGCAYEEQGKYQLSIKFFKKLLNYAKMIDDTTGVLVSSNRIAINYYLLGNLEISLLYHQQTLKLSTAQNSFSSFYNIGIVFRKLQKLEESMEHFQTSLQWSIQKEDLESQCISYGQIAITCFKSQSYQKSFQYFQKSLSLCYRLNKTQLTLLNLRYILKIIPYITISVSKTQIEIAEQAYKFAKLLEKIQLSQILSCNIGIIKGKKYIPQSIMQPDIQQV